MQCRPSAQASLVFRRAECARIIIVDEIRSFIGSEKTSLKEIDICLMDKEIIGFFEKELEKIDLEQKTGERRTGTVTCAGIFGIFNHTEASNIAYLGLHSLQHRGQESAGIVSADDYGIHSHKEMGLVSDIFDEPTLEKLRGNAAIGHVRYSTAGSSDLKNAQPFVVEYAKGPLAVAHNGNLTNAKIIRDELQNYGSIFQSSMDTEVIVHLIALSHENSTLERLISALRRVEGSYSALLLTDKEMIAVRDPSGFRPLVLGKLKDAHVVASETCAFDLCGS